MPYKILYVGENSDLLGEIKLELSEILFEEGVIFESLKNDTENIKTADMILFNDTESIPNIAQIKAKQNGKPIVFLKAKENDKPEFSVESPVFYSSDNKDPRMVAEFITLIMLFNRKMDSVSGVGTLQERLELLDEMIVDFGNSLNSKLCTIIGYADFALSESSVSEMQKALQIALEAGLDTAQLLQNMLLSVKAIIRKSARQKWVA